MTQVKERPILFSGPMIRALLNGTKTQTRRSISGKYIINNEPTRYKYHFTGESDAGVGAHFEDLRPEITPWITPVPCPYGKPGDHLFVREAHCKYGSGFIYRADYGDTTPVSDGIGGPWKHGIHMPRVASRILLEIVSVRVERLQDISEEDAADEGTGDMLAEREHWDGDKDAYRKCYKELWGQINGPKSWQANPWVWCVTFKVVAP